MPVPTSNAQADTSQQSRALDDERPLEAEPCDLPAAAGGCHAQEAPPPAPLDDPLPTHAELELHGRRCRLVCVDGVPPMQVARPGSPRQRHLYARGELVHFQLGEHRYALLPIEEPEQTDAGTTARPDPRQVLTNRELQIVQLICMGLLTKQVADRLHLSEFTVRSYLKTIYCKLGVRSRAGMVYTYAQVFGLTATPAG